MRTRPWANACGKASSPLTRADEVVGGDREPDLGLGALVGGQVDDAALVQTGREDGVEVGHEAAHRAVVGVLPDRVVGSVQEADHVVEGSLALLERGHGSRR